MPRYIEPSWLPHLIGGKVFKDIIDIQINDDAKASNS